MRKKIYIGGFIFAIIAFIGAIFLFYFLYAQSSELEVIFFDVGQGDSIFVKSPYGQNIIIDGGPDSMAAKKIAENLPWWDKRIDLMILSHPHDDHVVGLIDVLRRYDVKEILYTGVLHSSPGYLEWLDIINKKEIILKIIKEPQTIFLGENLFFEIIHPFENLAGEKVDNLNNSSIITKLIYGNISFLFSGDCEIEIEEKMLLSDPKIFNSLESKKGFQDNNIAFKINDILNANVFKAGHHGSDTSNSQDFLEAIFLSDFSGQKEKFFVIQVGEKNNFGHPSLRILKRVERMGINILRNDNDGDIKFISDGEKLEYFKK
jgi:competence protein ComEC